MLLSYIQYRTYESDYYKENLKAEELQKDRAEFAKRYPKLTKLLSLIKDLCYIGIPWLSFLVYFLNAFCNEVNAINYIIYAYSLILTTYYISSNKDTSSSLSRLIWLWNIGIALSVISLLTILVYQMLCLEQIAKTKLIQNLLIILPEVVKKNSALLGFRDYHSTNNSFELSIILLVYVLNFVFAIITKRYLSSMYIRVRISEQLGSLLPSTEQVKSHEYLRLLLFLRPIWPVLDFCARFTFVLLGLVIVAVSIHWKLSVFNLLFIIMI